MKSKIEMAAIYLCFKGWMLGRMICDLLKKAAFFQGIGPNPLFACKEQVDSIMQDILKQAFVNLSQLNVQNSNIFNLSQLNLYSTKETYLSDIKFHTFHWQMLKEHTFMIFHI